jgi:hypothetical protein
MCGGYSHYSTTLQQLSVSDRWWKGGVRLLLACVTAGVVRGICWCLQPGVDAILLGAHFVVFWVIWRTHSQLHLDKSHVRRAASANMWWVQSVLHASAAVGVRQDVEGRATAAGMCDCWGSAGHLLLPATSG